MDERQIPRTPQNGPMDERQNPEMFRDERRLEEHPQKFLLKGLITVVDRGRGEAVSKLLNRVHRCLHFLSLGKGTASSEVMDFLGLDEPEKDVLISLVPEDYIGLYLGTLKEQMHFVSPGMGIAFTVPFNSISAAISHRSCAATQQTLRSWQKEAPDMLERQFECIVAVVPHGDSDMIIEAARQAGAPGGTLVRARGLNSDEANKFFHITIQPEKELIFTIVPVGIKKNVMQSMCNIILSRSGEHGMVFSVPVDEAVGLRTPDDAMQNFEE